MGGGGFSTETGDSPIDAFILELARQRSGRDQPRVCFVGTATGDALDYWLRFQAAFAGRAETSRLTLFERTIEDIPSFVADQDALYVGGGNTASLLAVWRTHGLDRAIADARDDGLVLAGLSAGAICWFDAGTTDSYGPTLQPLTGSLGFVAGSCCPHYDGEPQRRPTFHRLVGDGTLPGGLAIDDGAAAVIDGDALVEVVASRAGSTAYRVASDGAGGVSEVAFPARVLR